MKNAKTVNGPANHPRIRPIRRLFLATFLSGLVLNACNSAQEGIPLPSEPVPADQADGDGADAYAGAAACQTCHPDEFADWKASQHASAARPFDPAADAAAFVPPHQVKHGSFESEIREKDGRFEILTVGAHADRRPYVPEAVIGIVPLRQYLIPFPGNRLQVAELAYDPEKHDWFDVFGEEDRQPDEWGFWANRGMNWNAQCAYCHMTRLEKGYDEAQDAYHTTWTEWGVSCEQCHGPMGRHVETHQTPPWPETEELTLRQIMDVCGSCHARRGELTGRFEPGELFLDHFRPDLPEHPQIYYPDGQIRDEDFEYGSFITSRMFHREVTCLDCHNPHSGKLIAPLENNALCMTCHGLASQRRDIPVIDAKEHGHHQPGTPGNACVNCHMPETQYMQRDPRRDHGFITPDPLLTVKLGIPNACSRCHSEKPPEWALEWAEKWYGDKLDRPARHRTLLVARAQDGDETAVPALLEQVLEEKIGAWRAVMTGLLGQWADRADVRATLDQALEDAHPLVRAAAVRALEPMADSEAALRARLEDPVRLVRVDAAWALRHDLRPTSRASQELVRQLAWQSDQPAGAWRRGEFERARNRLGEAEHWLAKAVEWDPATAWFRHSLGVVYHQRGRTAEAEEELKHAVRLEPGNAEHPYALALLYGETGEIMKAVHLFEDIVDQQPEFTRAWYNLGLARAQIEELDGAIEALLRAEALAPDAPAFPYARATIHYRQGEPGLARAAAGKALEADPAYTPAQSLLRQVR